MKRHVALRFAIPALAFVLGLGSPPRAAAQSIRDQVEQHVDEGLKKEPEKPKPEAKKKDDAPSKPKRPEKKAAERERQSGTKNKKSNESGSGFTWDSSASEPEKVVKDPLPHRILGKSIQLDPKIGGGYRGWLAQDYPRVSVPHTGYFTWSLELKAKLFRYISLRRGYYESNGLSAPRNHAASIAVQAGSVAPKAAWLFGVIGVDISPAWQPIISYEARAFQSTAIPREPVRIMPHNADPDSDISQFPQTTQTLRMVSGFETLVAGVRYDPTKSGSSMIGATNKTIPAFYLGAGFTSYSKPYQVTVGDSVLNELLFDARFRGAGLAFGLDTPERPERAFVDFSGQLGLGEVRLLDRLTLNETLPADWLIGYFQGNVTAGYLYPLIRAAPTLFLAGAGSAGGMTFFFFKTKKAENDTVDTPPLNWDFLWSARLTLILSL
jgi:hypothetical protein